VEGNAVLADVVHEQLRRSLPPAFRGDCVQD
jgi:hypothetical protein